MARKAARKGAGVVKPKAKSAPGSKIRKIENYEDTLEEGGVDDFMFKRDQILFNPQDESEEEDINADQGEEVLGLKVPSRKNEEYEEEDEEYYSDEAPKKRERKKKTKEDVSGKGRFGKPIESSDDEEEETDSGSDDEEGWGRQYYSRPSNRREKEDEDEFDEKREEEKDMEEREVKRLQKKAREAFGGAEDWGLEEGGVTFTVPAAINDDEEESLPPPVAAPDTTDPAALIRHLEANEPVKIALARDYPLTVHKLQKTAKGIAQMAEEKEGEESIHKGLGWLHYQTLLTYATTLAYYLHLCALPPRSRPDFTPILTRLVQLKEGVAMLEDLDFAAGSVSDLDPLAATDGLEDQDEEELKELMKNKKELMARMMLASGSGVELMDDEDDKDGLEYDESADMDDLWQKEGLEDGELDDLLADADVPSDLDDEMLDDEEIEVVKPKKKKVKENGVEKKGKKEKKEKTKEKANGTTPQFTPLEEPTFVSCSSKKSSKRSADNDIMGDPTSLDEADAADKERRKRSLQFHTAKIASTSARRAAARAERLGGDEDLPYRDRKAARDAALRKNSAKAEGQPLDGSDFNESDRKRAREVREEDAEGGDDDADGDADADAEGYYNLVKRRRTEKKAAKAAAHEEFMANQVSAFDEETHEGGPRALTRAIEKNRGLTPRRSKTGRNPRVKKRLAYEKAKQKVGSQRAVFKGGQAKLGGSYAGEKTGISQVVKSRKF